MNWHEIPLVFECEGSRLVGIIARPERACRTGVVVVVGGPQYRAGSHRQFALLARAMADKGIASLRFDYRGMGDSEGGARTFEQIDSDIRAAINELMARITEIEQVVLWGLCDGVSASLFYANTDNRVSGLLLLNPWVHSEMGAARARLRHYYWERLFSRSFWAKLLSGKLQLNTALTDLTASARQARGSTSHPVMLSLPLKDKQGTVGFIDRMLSGLKKFKGPVHFVLSEKDLTAQEFIALTHHHKMWRAACRHPRIEVTMFADANHTFAKKIWRNQVEQLTIDWIYRAPSQF